jgi:fatty acid desaturase
MLPINIKWYQWIWGATVNVKSVWYIFKTFFRHAFGRNRDKVLKTEWEKRIFPPEDRKGYRAMVNWARIVLIGQTILAVVFVVTGNWILLFLVTFAPFCATWFVMLTHMPQHVGMRPDVADWRQSTRTYLAGPIVRFFYWNMNYHVEHHMYAAVPFYNLPKLRKAIITDLPAADRGLVATWKEIYSTVRKQKADPGYFYTPQLPATAGSGPG